MSDLLAEFVRISRYAKYLPEKNRRETWKEQVDRVMDMHKMYFSHIKSDAFKTIFDAIKIALYDQRILGSQRALQFGGPSILNKHARMYNCTATYVDRPRVFQEVMWLLLCGCGVGVSVQKHHIDKLPEIKEINKDDRKTFIINDSIEGWADAIGTLMYSYFNIGEYAGKYVLFDYARIRPKGAAIANIDGKAPGPEPLRKAIEHIREVIENRIKAVKEAHNISNLDGEKTDDSKKFKKHTRSEESKEIRATKKRKGDKSIIIKLSPEHMEELKHKHREDNTHAHFSEIKHTEKSIKLRPIDAFDIITHASDAVIAGGVRRSALITLFSLDDEEMLSAKTGSWFINNPQRGRSNNSVVLMRNEVTKEQFKSIIKHTQEFGEPGFIWVDDLETLYNPCGEIRLNGHDKFGNSGCEFCNLTEINMKAVKTADEFYDSCRLAAALGTLQAAYTNFPYLGEVTERIVREEALIGVSMTGMMDNPKIAFDPKIQRKGAEIVIATNKMIAKLIGINKAARCTTVKPAGSTSCLLASASGIHPHHAKRYFRRVQSNKTEKTLQYFKSINPLCVEESKWSSNNTDDVVTFLCEAPEGALTKDEVNTIDLLKYVKLTQQNWIKHGSESNSCHNVSNTITVKDEEWMEVADFIYDNRSDFAGVSLLSASGDRDYVQAPFQTVYTPEELIKMYGAPAMFASGVIVHAAETYDGNLYRACDTFLGIGEKLDSTLIFDKKCIQQSIEKTKKLFDKFIWDQRAEKFSNKYFGGNKYLTMTCLKDIDAFKTWYDISRSIKPVDWTQFVEYEDTTNPMADTACAGGVCHLVRI